MNQSINLNKTNLFASTNEKNLNKNRTKFQSKKHFFEPDLNSTNQYKKHCNVTDLNELDHDDLNSDIEFDNIKKQDCEVNEDSHDIFNSSELITMDLISSDSYHSNGNDKTNDDVIKMNEKSTDIGSSK